MEIKFARQSKGSTLSRYFCKHWGKGFTLGLGKRFVLYSKVENFLLKRKPMPELGRKIHQALIQEVKRRLLQESLPRTRQCLASLTETEIWHRPNENSNSVGNLVLHLCGNVRQWLISALGQTPDLRTRDAEFAEKGPLPTEQLLELIDKLERDLTPVLDQLRPEDLVRSYTVQGFAETGLSILVHVVEHFSYHVGQITYFVKAHKNLDTAYYAGHDL
jgi:uncharacterized damage-inducible protein DinB